MNKYVEIGARIRKFGENKFSSMSEFASALKMRPQTLNNYLSGQARPGGIMQERLRKLGCDVHYIMYGETTGDKNTQFNNMMDRKWRESNPDKAKVLDYLERLGIENEEQLKALFDPESIAEDVAVIIQRRMEQIKEGRKK